MEKGTINIHFRARGEEADKIREMARASGLSPSRVCKVAVKLLLQSGNEQRQMVSDGDYINEMFNDFEEFDRIGNGDGKFRVNLRQ